MLDPAKSWPAPVPPGETFSACLLQQLPATVWTTDVALTLTFLRSPGLDRIGLREQDLVGHRLADLLSDGGADHPILEAHRTALAGAEAPIRLDWGQQRFIGRVVPLRSRTGDVMGCAGLAQMTERDIPIDRLLPGASPTWRQRLVARVAAWVHRPPAGPDLAAVRDHIRADLVVGAVALWVSDPNGRVRPLLIKGDVTLPRVAEPFAGLAVARGERQWSDAASGWLIPLVWEQRSVGVLGVLGSQCQEPDEPLGRIAQSAAEDIVRRLDRPAPGVPARGRAAGARRAVLLACLTSS
jgi:hypothetical protein